MGRTRTVVEVMRSSKYRYEIVRTDEDSIISNGTSFYVMCDGKQVAGRYADLRDAVAWARRQGAS